MVVRMRSTKSRRNNRRAHHSCTPPSIRKESGIFRISHRMSRLTGLYRGKTIVDVSKKQKRMEVKKEEKTASKQEAISQTNSPEKNNTEMAAIPTIEKSK